MSWEEIVATASKLEEEWRADASLAWYRGHADTTWLLECSLHREIRELLKNHGLNPSETRRAVLIRETYKTDYRDFRSSAWPLLAQYERSDWGIVFAMQHYGQVTRLLDWTESLACAAYFALEIKCDKCYDSTKDAAIWMLDPQALNHQSQGVYASFAVDHPSDIQADEKSTFDLRAWHPKYKAAGESGARTIAVTPDFTNPRMISQRAAFTMSGDCPEPLDKEFPKLVELGRLRKFVLTPTVKKQAAAFLRAAGLDAYSYYPDLHGLALRHKEQGRRRLELMEKLKA
jgi:hypothetical protein